MVYKAPWSRPPVVRRSDRRIDEHAPVPRRRPHPSAGERGTRGGPPVHRPPPSRTASSSVPSASAIGGKGRDRFRELDEYRVEREWKRYEGTPQRDLFRELRTRFLRRHTKPGRWVLDVGPGPGRFTPMLGEPGSRRVLLDLSVGMLAAATRRFSQAAPGEPAPDLVRGDAARPPFRAGQFVVVALLGNVIGFAEAEAESVLDASLELLAPGGRVVVETVAGPGERSRYLCRLPPGAIRRLLVAPINAVRPRIEREGFRAEPTPPGESRFRRLGEQAVHAAFERHHVEPEETLAVAPSLGSDPERIAAARLEPAAWRHLLELEEVLGRTGPRRAHAAALLLSGVKKPSPSDPATGTSEMRQPSD